MLQEDTSSDLLIATLMNRTSSSSTDDSSEFEYSDEDTSNDDIIASFLSEELARQSLNDLDPNLSNPFRPTKQTSCVSCLESLPPPSFPSAAITTTCSHHASSRELICADCLRQSLAVQLESKGPSGLTCPLCHERLAHVDVLRWASRQTFELYDARIARNAFQEEEGFVWCANPNCSEGQIHEGGENLPIVICKNCGTKTCFVHGGTWHDGMTCYEVDHPGAAEKRWEAERAEEQAIRQREEDEERRRVEEKERAEIKAREEERRKRREEEKSGEKVVRASSKQCPGKGCQFRIQKGDGCKHMTCTFTPIPLSYWSHLIGFHLVPSLMRSTFRYALSPPVLLGLQPTMGERTSECCLLSLMKILALPHRTQPPT